MLIPVVVAVASVTFAISLWRHKHAHAGAEKGLPTILTINGKDHIFPVTRGADAQQCIFAAVRFCSEEGKNMGFSMDTFYDCVKPISENLIDKVQSSHTKKVANTVTTATNTSNVQQPSMSDTSGTVGDVAQQSSLPQQRTARRIPVTINGVQYGMELPFNENTAMEDAIKATMSFCQTNAASLGFTEEEQASKDVMVARCITPMLDAARAVIPRGDGDGSGTNTNTNKEVAGPSAALEPMLQSPPSISTVCI